jgi:hypothetical protein
MCSKDTDFRGDPQNGAERLPGVADPPPDRAQSMVSDALGVQVRPAWFTLSSDLDPRRPRMYSAMVSGW